MFGKPLHISVLIIGVRKYSPHESWAAFLDLFCHVWQVENRLKAYIGKYIGHFFKVCPRQRMGWNYGLKRLRWKRKFQYHEKTNTSSKGMTESKYWPYCSSMLCEMETRSRYSSSCREQLDKEMFKRQSVWIGQTLEIPKHGRKSRNPVLWRSKQAQGPKIWVSALGTFIITRCDLGSSQALDCLFSQKSQSAILQVGQKTFQLIRLNSAAIVVIIIFIFVRKMQ